MLCCTLLCRSVLYCAWLSCALHYLTVLCCAVLGYTVLFCSVLLYDFTVLCCIVLCCTVLNCTELNWAVPYTVLCCTYRYGTGYTALCCTVLYCAGAAPPWYWYFTCAVLARHYGCTATTRVSYSYLPGAAPVPNWCHPGAASVLHGQQFTSSVLLLHWGCAGPVYLVRTSAPVLYLYAQATQVSMRRGSGGGGAWSACE